MATTEWWAVFILFLVLVLVFWSWLFLVRLFGPFLFGRDYFTFLAGRRLALFVRPFFLAWGTFLSGRDFFIW